MFVDAPTDTGKKFMIDFLLQRKVRLVEFIALGVASSGIASNPLAARQILHSTFKSPLNLFG